MDGRSDTGLASKDLKKHPSFATKHKQCCTQTVVVVCICRLTNKLATKLANYVEQSLYRKANVFSTSQGIPHLLWQPKIHCCFHKSPLHVPIQSHIIPVYHRLLRNRFKIHLDITLRGLRGLPSGLYLSRL